MTTQTIEERVARVETAIEFIRENMATRADLEKLNTRLEEAEKNTTRWMVVLMLTGMAISSTVAFAMARLVN